MKKYYMQPQDQEIGEAITQTLEKETGKKIFTMRMLEPIKKTQSFDVVVIFEDTTVLMGSVGLQEIDGYLAFRFKLNYV